MELRDTVEEISDLSGSNSGILGLGETISMYVVNSYIYFYFQKKLLLTVGLVF